MREEINDCRCEQLSKYGCPFFFMYIINYIKETFVSELFSFSSTLLNVLPAPGENSVDPPVVEITVVTGKVDPVNIII